MVRTYWLVLGFYEASSNLDLQPFARTDQVETRHPRANCLVILPWQSQSTKRPKGHMPEREFDVVVIGAGPAGEIAAGRLSKAGLSVAIAEVHLVAGECSYYACMPSKALLRPGELLAEANRVPGVREAVTGDLDPQAVLERRDEVIHDLDDSSQVEWLDDLDIELFRSEGRFDGERRVSVGDDTLVASRAVIVSTGSAAVMPPIDGLADAEAWNNREGTTSKKVPESMVVLGGGPVGSELSQAWGSLGTEVTLIEGSDRILGKAEPFASEEVTDSLRDQGIDVRVGVKAVKVERGGETVTVTLEGGDEIVAAEILVAVGRKPRTEDLALDSIGVETGDHGFLEVDDELRVGGSEWLYAIGDVNGRALLTHMGKYQAWVTSEIILGHEAKASAEALGSPHVTFTDPQVASVGKTLEEARGEGIDATAADVSTSGNAGASFYGKDTPGTSRIVVDQDRGVIIGATFVGFETADFLQAATVAVVGEVPVERLHHAIAPFPSRSEVWLKLLEELDG